ncbi:MAG: ComEC/Rec2 family competence protein [Nitrospirota bacterium]
MTKFAISFIGGIAAFNFFPFFPGSIVTLCTVVMFSFLYFYRNEKRKIISIIILFFSGFVYSSARYIDQPPLLLPEHDILITGTIIDVPEMSGEKIRFTLDNVFLEEKQIEGKVRLAVLRSLFNENRIEDILAPGFVFRAVVKLKEPHTFQNPGVPSYDLKKDGISAVGFVRYLQFTGKSSGLLLRIHKQRQRLGMIMDNSLSQENAAFHKAIIPGLKKSISVEMRDAFSSTGLAHLLSISGTHFGLLAFIVFIIVRTSIKLLPSGALLRISLYITPTQIAAVLTLPVLLMYAMISGASTPTVRSLIMVVIYMLAIFLGRKNQWLNSLSIAALIILIWQPSALFKLSFQLSFLAVLSIGYLLEQRAKHAAHSAKGIAQKIQTAAGSFPAGQAGQSQGIIERLKAAMLITVAAVFGTAPLAALYFKQLPLISPITNLVITPLVCFLVLPLGFFTGLAALVFKMPVMPLSGLTDSLTYFALGLINFFAQIPYSNLHVHDASVFMIGLYYFSLILMIRSSELKVDRGTEENKNSPSPPLPKGGSKQVPLWQSRRSDSGGIKGDFIIKRKVQLRFLPFIFVICLYIISPHQSGNKLRVTFLDVGQGDAAVIELPDGKVMLIDGGINEPDMGRRVIAPYLWSEGIRKLDYMVLSHPHSDHFGGLDYIVENFDVGEVWSNGRAVYEVGGFFRKISDRDIPYKTLSRGDFLERDNYSVHVFHPYDEFYASSARGAVSGQNSDSLVLKIESGDMSVLFTGDIEMEAEDNLVHLSEWIESDIIKVPHHGSSTSSSREFISAVNPEIAVISAGRNNPFKHPHKETLARYRTEGVRLIRTDIDGAVAIMAEDYNYIVKTYKDSKFKNVEEWRDEMNNLRLLF